MIAIPYPNIKQHPATMGWGCSTPTPEKHTTQQRKCSTWQAALETLMDSQGFDLQRAYTQNTSTIYVYIYIYIIVYTI